MSEFAFQDCTDLVRHVLDTDYFVGTKRTPAAIPATWVPGRSKLVVVVGPNASGKSFFRRVVRSACHLAEPKIECIHLSMEARTQGYLKSFVYGDEQYQATGVNSINTVLGGIRTSQGRTEPHAIVWDEPDLGLSEANAASVGKTIVDFIAAPPPCLFGVVVITHRRALVAELQKVGPHYVHLGVVDPPATLDAWMTEPIVTRPLDEIAEESHTRFKAIQKILNKRRIEN